MIREPARRSSRRGHHVHVQIPFIFTREGDLRSIGRKDRIGLQADAIRQSLGLAAFPRNDPEITGEPKSHMRPADGWLLEEERFVLLPPTGRCSRQRGNQSKD